MGTGDAIITGFPNEFPQDGAATLPLSLIGTDALMKVASWYLVKCKITGRGDDQ